MARGTSPIGWPPAPSRCCTTPASSRRGRARRSGCRRWSRTGWDGQSRCASSPAPGCRCRRSSGRVSPGAGSPAASTGWAATPRSACGRGTCRRRWCCAIGPLDRAGFEALLPDRPALGRLVSLVRAFLGFETAFSINPVLSAAEVPPLRLRADSDPAPRLGWNTWLTAPAGSRRTDADDPVFQAEVMEARSAARRPPRQDERAARRCRRSPTTTTPPSGSCRAASKRRSGRVAAVAGSAPSLILGGGGVARARPVARSPRRLPSQSPPRRRSRDAAIRAAAHRDHRGRRGDDPGRPVARSAGLRLRRRAARAGAVLRDAARAGTDAEPARRVRGEGRRAARPRAERPGAGRRHHPRGRDGGYLQLRARLPRRRPRPVLRYRRTRRRDAAARGAAPRLRSWCRRRCWPRAPWGR